MSQWLCPQMVVQTRSFSMFPAGLGFDFPGSVGQARQYSSTCFSASRILFLLSSLQFTLSLQDYSCHCSRDFRKEQKLTDIVLNPLFLPNFLPLFVEQIFWKAYQLQSTWISKENNTHIYKQYSNVQQKVSICILIIELDTEIVIEKFNY